MTFKSGEDFWGSNKLIPTTKTSSDKLKVDFLEINYLRDQEDF